MDQNAPSFPVSNPLLLALAAVLATVSITLSTRISDTSETLALSFSIFTILLSIWLFIKGSRPINVTLLDTGLEVGQLKLARNQILNIELNERYRRIHLLTTGAKRPAIYYLKRKGDIPYVRQFLLDWSKRTGVSVTFKDSWS